MLDSRFVTKKLLEALHGRGRSQYLPYNVETEL